MQTPFTGYVTRPEWRWVTIVSAVFFIVAFLPLGGVAIGQSAAASGEAWRFMGVLHQVDDGAFAMALMRQGSRGDWLVQLQHTPEVHRSALIHPIYVLLGQASGWLPNAGILLFHVTRLFASLLMYVAIYQLAASVFTKLRARRIFFIIASVGSGLGWLPAVSTGELLTPDMTMPQIFPFYASLANVHLPLSIAGLAFAMAVLVTSLRVGEQSLPSVQNGGLVVFMVAVLLSFVQPEVLLPLMLAFTLAIGIGWWAQKRVTARELHWLMWLVVPTLPIAMYYWLTLRSNDALSLWFVQRQTPLLSPLWLAIGFGVPLLLALPSIAKAIRMVRADSDRLFLIWLLVMLGLFYLPLPPHEAFLTGGMLPIAYFATRALEDFWLELVKRRWHLRLFVLFVPIIALSNLFVAFVPVAPLLRGQFTAQGGVLPTEYAAAFEWMLPRVNANTVVLAAPSVSRWIPAWTGARVVAGHQTATLQPKAKEAFVRQWYSSSREACPDVLARQISSVGSFSVDFVLYGALERALGAGACLQDLRLVATFGMLELYFCDIQCKLRGLADCSER